MRKRPQEEGQRTQRLSSTGPLPAPPLLGPREKRLVDRRGIALADLHRTQSERLELGEQLGIPLVVLGPAAHSLPAAQAHELDTAGARIRDRDGDATDLRPAALPDRILNDDRH